MSSQPRLAVRPDADDPWAMDDKAAISRLDLRDAFVGAGAVRGTTYTFTKYG
jgi:hypothetical protein